MLHTLRCKRAIWRVWSTPWRQRAIGKVWDIWVIAHANVWSSHGLVPAARHANLGLAHREMLPGLGRRDRVLDCWTRWKWWGWTGQCAPVGACRQEHAA